MLLPSTHGRAIFFIKHLHRSVLCSGSDCDLWSPKANDIIGSHQTEPPSDSPAPVLNIFLLVIYFSDIYIAQEVNLLQKKTDI